MTYLIIEFNILFLYKYFIILKEKMNKTCATKPLPSTKTRLSELISWRLFKKNPSGALIWGIFGASLIIDSYFWVHFLRRKEYQVIIKQSICYQIPINF